MTAVFFLCLSPLCTSCNHPRPPLFGPVRCLCYRQSSFVLTTLSDRQRHMSSLSPY
ncbi:hypothetical protein L210DRAFT_3516717, partial [Boletus edulis BED1]